MIEENADKQSAEKPKKRRTQVNPNSLKNLIAPWTSETRPHSPGRPKGDTAADISRAAFENNKEVLYQQAVKSLMSGSPYAWDVHANRAYGKLKETKELTHKYEEVADADLNKRIAELERELGLAAQIDEAGRVGIAQAGESETHVGAKDTDVLS